MRATTPTVVFMGLTALSGAYSSRAQQTTTTSEPVLVVSSSTADPRVLIDPGAAAWKQIRPERIALNRTPRIFETESASVLEIKEVEVRPARSAGKLIVRLSWRDSTEDAATIAAAPETPAEGRFLKEPTEATNRFFDAAAVMVPAADNGGHAAPSLQMGDQNNPVIIYLWNAARGPMVMDARGRETTRRTGKDYPARALYQNGTWYVSFELPGLPPGTPLAFAIWNGSQQDRDGRKYFSIWHWLK